MMPDVAVMTDSNCGILPEAGKELGIYIIPMPILIDGRTYFEGVDIQAGTFYKLQAEGADVTSSQPSPGDVMDMWEKLLEVFKEVVYIPMSSGLSNSCASAMGFAKEYKGRVHVVDNHRISLTLAQSAMDAQSMARQGMSGSQIKAVLEQEALDAVIYIAVDTLEYLKRGGRVTAAGAAIGSVLNIKPILTIQGDKLDAYAKVRGMKAAFKTMIHALEKDVSGRFKPLYDKGELQFGFANTLMEEETAELWKNKLKSSFPGVKIMHSPLTLSIGCHTGPGALGMGVFRKRGNCGL